MARKFNSNGIADGTLPGTKISSGTISASLVGSVRISSISITDNSYVVLDDTAVILTGGYIKIIGTGFVSGCSVAIDTIIATSVSFVSATQLNVQVPAKAAGTYNIYLTTPTGAVAIRVNAITYSSTPTWVSTSPLPGGVNNTAISIQLGATSDSTISYTVQAGSTLPTGLTLSSGGLLSGTVTGLVLETTYNFTVVATDVELQDSPKAFSITIVVSDPYFKNTVLLLQGDATPFTADASTNKFEISAVGTPSANVNNPLQPGYYSGYFPGTTSYYIAATIPALTSFTVECWAYFSGSVASRTILTIGDDYTSSGFEMYTGSGGVLTVGNSTGSVQGSVPVANSWYHLAATRVGSTLTFYVNGVSVGTPASMGSTTLSTALKIGYELWNGSISQPWLGYISNLRIVSGVTVYTGAFTPPTSPLAATQSAGTNIAAITGTATSLLTLQSYRFIDNSTYQATLTPAGTPSISVTQPFTLPSPYTGYGSGLFDGSSYLTIPNNAAFAPAALDFTIEAWVYINALTAGAQTIFGQTDSAGTAGSGIYFYACNSTGYPLVIIPYGGANYAVTSPTVIAIKQWNHIAVSRYGAIITLYVNGVASGTTNFASLALTTSSQINGIGRNGAGNFEYLNGYIYNLRFVKGTAVYTGAFTPPTAPLAATQSSGTNIAAITGTVTSLLTLQTNQAQNNNQFRDSSINNFTVTRSGTPTQGTFTPFSQTGWSAYFNGAMSMSTPGAFNTAMVGLAGSLWTLELWIYVGVMNAGNGGGGGIIGTYDAVAANGRWIFYYGGTGPFTIGLGSTTGTGSQFNVDTTATFPLATWTHIAMTIDATTSSNSTVVLYINGVGQTFTGRNMSTQGTNYGTVTIGGNHSVYVNPLNGYINNLRFIKGAIAYTGNFTPPTLASLTNAGATSVSAYSSTTNVNITFAASVTLLLTFQSNRFKDNSINNFDLGGGASIQAFSPFAPSAAYSTSAVGGSMYFNGTTDWITKSGAADTITGDFTVDCWLYFNSTSGYQTPLSTFNNSGAFMWQTYGSTFYFYNPNNLNAQFYTFTFVPFQWYYIAMTRSGSTVTAYVNGTALATVAASGTLDISILGNGAYPAGGYTGAYTFNGYMSNFRIVKSALTITVPTAPFSAAGTSFLLSGTNAGIYDATAKNDLITVGDARVSTSVTKYGTGAMYFDGTGDWLSINAPTNLLNFGTGDFTIECWVYLNAVPSGYPPIITNENGFYINFRGSGTIALTDTSTVYATSPSALTAGSWFHVAIVRSSGSSRIYVNGTGGTAVACSVNWTATTITYIGGSPSYPAINGYIDDLRVTKYARYTTTFTPPSQAMLGM